MDTQPENQSNIQIGNSLSGNNLNKDIKNIPPNPTFFMGFLIWQKAASWERHLNSRLKNAGLNQSEYFHLLALFWLMQNQMEITQVELSRYLGTTTMSTSKIIQKLEKEGFVNRKTGRDSRSKAIYCTPKGEEFILVTAKSIIKTEDEFFNQENKKEVLKYLRS